ncbi:hypothetical protein CLOAM1246 [Candidatus Cloacimonas acidaminovorans str. Evry]|uniref:Uncharacterized protein n=1 Tax=Cloacimonas acidaminovorans (strain Evry) TaxID=459349 RepID=B0VIB8_CLOAI|nr:hypothetical protein CLOAM1246 [Candidatus Cloacimonas acidaminovorans str. Evry]
MKKMEGDFQDTKAKRELINPDKGEMKGQ